MLTIFMYPVSGIMKLWHLLIANLVDYSVGWLISIVLLVLTVRGLIAPLNWISVRSARLAVLMRPRNRDIDQRIEKATTAEEMVALMREREELAKEFGYRPAAGCVPPLIMIPVFIGLYQVLLRMARVNMHVDSIGLLNPQDIASFRASTFLGVPITDFARDHFSLITPLLIAAIAFTVINTGISIFRGFLTTQFDQKANRRIFWFMLAVLFFVPWLLWHVAQTGPIPVAIIFYWGCAYLFSLVQTIVFELIMLKRYPLPDLVHELRRESITRWRNKESTPKLSREQKKEKALLQVEARKILREAKTAAKQETKTEVQTDPKLNNPPEEPKASD